MDCRWNGSIDCCFQPDLYLRAYGKLYANEGAMTRGATAETVDGMSLAKIDHHRRLLGTLSVEAGTADLHPEEERETAAVGNAELVG